MKSWEDRYNDALDEIEKICDEMMALELSKNTEIRILEDKIHELKKQIFKLTNTKK